MRNDRIAVLTEIALAVALAAVLNLPMLRIQLPFNYAGGTISLNMLPVIVVALRRGLVPGLIAGALYGCVDALANPYFVHPIQVLLDYPIAYGLVGLAGMGALMLRREKTGAVRHWAVLLTAMLLGVGGRFCAHWLSGVVFFRDAVPAGQPVWLYSLVYNSSYLLPSFALTLAAALLVFPALERAVPVRTSVGAGAS